MNKKGLAYVVMGLQYGDEGKAKVTDGLLKTGFFGVDARYNGGGNSGHSLKVGNQEIVLNHIPSGIFYPDIKKYFGSGGVIFPPLLNEERKNIQNLGINIDDQLFISPCVTLVQPSHIFLDSIYGKEIGTTVNGIGPAYSDQATRIKGSMIANLRIGDYFINRSRGLDVIMQNLESILEHKDINLVNFKQVSNRLGVDILSSKDIDIKQITDIYVESLNKLENNCTNDLLFLVKELEDGNNVLCEGAQSSNLDCVSGLVPCVTSSRTLSAAAFLGADIPTKYHGKVFGIAKAIMSRVGNGPFVSEFGGYLSELYCAEGDGYAHVKEIEERDHEYSILSKSINMHDIGKFLRYRGNEYGARTKRPRRIGALDLVDLEFNCKRNGVDGLVITKFDCLTIFNETALSGIPVVIGYEINGKPINYRPTSEEELRRVKPIFNYFPKFNADFSKVETFEDLPKNAKDLIRFIEKRVGTEIYGIGTGPERDQFIEFKQFIA